MEENNLVDNDRHLFLPSFSTYITMDIQYIIKLYTSITKINIFGSIHFRITLPCLLCLPFKEFRQVL